MARAVVHLSGPPSGPSNPFRGRPVPAVNEDLAHSAVDVVTGYARRGSTRCRRSNAPAALKRGDSFLSRPGSRSHHDRSVGKVGCVVVAGSAGGKDVDDHRALLPKSALRREKCGMGTLRATRRRSCRGSANPISPSQELGARVQPLRGERAGLLTTAFRPGSPPAPVGGTPRSRRLRRRVGRP